MRSRQLLVVLGLVSCTAEPALDERTQHSEHLSCLDLGKIHSCASSLDAVWCWGDNSVSQLGNGVSGHLVPYPQRSMFATPQLVVGVADTTELALGGGFSLARTTTGETLVWGVDPAWDGRVLATRIQFVAVDHAPARDLVALFSGGSSHACGIDSAGVVWCWGDNGRGQLGDGTTRSRPTAAPVAALVAVTQGDLGESHTCVRRSDDTAWCWGENFGRLGDGTTIRRTTPVRVSGLGGVAEVRAGRQHSCARRSDGTVWCWGANGFGELGNGTRTTSLTAVPVSGLTGATAIAVGSGFSCARKADGSVWCWGLDASGALGDGGTLPSCSYGCSNESVSSATPRRTLVTDAVELAAGDHHACVRDSTDDIWCWGYNAFGQLGDGTFISRSAPVRVGTPF